MHHPLDSSGAAHPGLASYARFTREQRQASAARFASWLEEEMAYAMADRALLAEVFEEVSRTEQKAGPADAAKPPPGKRVRSRASGRGTRR